MVVRTGDGTIIHARNLDFDNADAMREITYNARFVHGDKYSFDAVMFGGVVGTYTGVKKGAFSVSENQRSRVTTEMSLLENMVMLFSGYSEISWKVREVLDQCDSYKCAEKRLTNETVNSIGYIILAGIEKNEGVVISRDRYGPAHLEFLNDTNWFLIQTNDDHWQPSNPELMKTGRYAAAKYRVEKIGQNKIDAKTIKEQVLMRYPTLNDITVYNSVLVPQTGSIESTNIKYFTDTDAESKNEFKYIEDLDPTFDRRLKQMYDSYDSDFLPFVGTLLKGQLFTKMNKMIDVMADYYIGK